MARIPKSVEVEVLIAVAYAAWTQFDRRREPTGSWTAEIHGLKVTSS